MSARSVVLSATSAALLLVGCGGSDGPAPPPADATKLVPRDALVYVHLSTDTGRGPTADAARQARRFSGFAGLRDSIVRRLQAPGCKVPFDKGREAAVALLDSRSGVAGSLVIVDSGDDAKEADRTCGAVKVARIGRFTVIGQDASVAAARALAKGRGRSLADDEDYRRALGRLPADRAADAWVTRDGVRRLLAPQNGLLGVVGTLLDQPRLKATALSLGGDGRSTARLVIASQLTGGTIRTFTPKLASAVPARAFAYLGTRGLEGVTARLLAQVPGGVDTRALSRIFPGEVAVALTYAVPAPVLTIIAQPTDAATARRALTRIGLKTALVGGRLVASTRASGIAAVRSARRHLTDTAAWKAVQAKASNPVTSLVFLDFNQLLRLAERTGIDQNPSYRAVQRDLRRIAVVGARSTGAGDETTVEILLSIP